jgi:hypothetical protein
VERITTARRTAMNPDKILNAELEMKLARMYPIRASACKNTEMAELKRIAARDKRQGKRQAKKKARY